MSNTLHTRVYNGQQIRFVFIDEKPWFMATDVLAAYRNVTSQGAGPTLAAIFPEYKRKENKTSLNIPNAWRHKAWLVSGLGLYQMTARDGSLNAKALYKWATDEVINPPSNPNSYLEEQVAGLREQVEEQAVTLREQSVMLREQSAVLKALLKEQGELLKALVAQHLAELLDADLQIFHGEKGISNDILTMGGSVELALEAAILNGAGEDVWV